MSKKKIDSPTEFPITASEFLGSLPNGQIEMRKTFAKLVTGKKTRAEWAHLFTAFQTKPTGIDWNDWLAQNPRRN